MPTDTFGLIKSLLNESMICVGWLVFIGATLHESLKPPILPTDGSIEHVSLYDKFRVRPTYHFLYALTGMCLKCPGLALLFTVSGNRESILGLIDNLGNLGHAESAGDIASEVDNVRDILQNTKSLN